MKNFDKSLKFGENKVSKAIWENVSVFGNNCKLLVIK